MALDLTGNYFDILGLPTAFPISQEQLSARYRRLQHEFHPDRYAGKSRQEHRLAVQYTAALNQAFQTLKDPVSRARYMLELAGEATEQHMTIDDPGFLMEQMSLREALQEARESGNPYAKLEELAVDAAEKRRQLTDDFAGQINTANFGEARATLAKMQFFSKLITEIELLEEELDQ